MKLSNIIIAFLVLFAFSCQEKMNPIIIIQPTGNRVVLLEEYSGGSCVPCANAHADIENLLGVYGHNLVVVTIHTFLGGQANPVQNSTYDFRNQDGHDIVGTLGYPEGIPSGILNRKKYSSEDDLQLPVPAWAGYIAAEVAEVEKLGLKVSTTYDAASRSLGISVDISPFENIGNDPRLTVMITESGIVDKQATPDGVVDDYVHNHILRDVISSIEGDVLGDLAAQQDKQINFTYTLPEADGSGPWIPENCQIIAFVSYAGQGGASKDILQAAEAKVIE